MLLHTRKLILLLTGMGITFLVAVPTTQVFAANIYLSTPTREIGVGQKFEVKIYVDTQGESINALSGTVVFPNNMIQLDVISDANSVVQPWIESPHVASNEVSFAGVIPGGYVGKDGLLFTLQFYTVSSGNDQIKIESARALKNDGTGSGVMVSTSPLLLITSIMEGYTSSITEILDSEPPEPFIPEIARVQSVFDNKWFVSFTAVDKGTGISHYEVKEVMSPLFAVFMSWKIAQNPYSLSDQSLRSYVYIRAIDQAGNIRTQRINPTRSIAWYNNWQALAVLILVCSLSFIYWLWKRK